MRMILAMVAVAMPAAVSASERTGHVAIAAGDWVRAEREIAAERRIFPARPELMLNLAAVYSRTGRAAAARALYVAVLDRPAVLMDLPDGATGSSHDLANRGLNRLSPIASSR